jgi:hypothetical protein
LNTSMTYSPVLVSTSFGSKTSSFSLSVIHLTAVLGYPCRTSFAHFFDHCSWVLPPQALANCARAVRFVSCVSMSYFPDSHESNLVVNCGQMAEDVFTSLALWSTTI